VGFENALLRKRFVEGWIAIHFEIASRGVMKKDLGSFSAGLFMGRFGEPKTSGA
jgi:hypothetical protein